MSYFACKLWAYVTGRSFRVCLAGRTRREAYISCSGRRTWI